MYAIMFGSVENRVTRAAVLRFLETANERALQRRDENTKTFVNEKKRENNAKRKEDGVRFGSY